MFSEDLAVVLFRDEVQPQQRMEEYLNEEDEEEEDENKFAHTYTHHITYIDNHPQIFNKLRLRLENRVESLEQLFLAQHSINSNNG